MLWRTLSVFLLASLLSLFAVSPLSAITKSSPVELTVPDTTVTIQGYAAPGAFVTIEESGAVIGTATADSSGYFSTILLSQPTGIRSLELYYRDVEAIRSAVYEQSLSVQPQQNTTLDVFLSPTVTRRTAVEVQQGSLVQISGYSVPGATVQLSGSVSSLAQTTIAGTSGFYEFLVDTAGFEEKTYTLRVEASFSSLDVSSPSRQVSFNVVSSSGPSGPDIVVRPDLLPPPIPLSPDDGAVIDGDSVIVSGESVPNAQINIFENDIVIGSIFADEFGKWSFEYLATSSPVILSFEACVDGSCSVLSRRVTLNFASFGFCDVDFRLEQYRFWGLSVNETVALAMYPVDAPGVIDIDWGDGRVETFDHDSDQPREFRSAYDRTGQFNGTITFYEGENRQKAECKITRYFSMHVTAESSNFSYWRIFWLFLIALVAYIINYYVNKDKS